jgi:hypothetical protein
MQRADESRKRRAKKSSARRAAPAGKLTASKVVELLQQGQSIRTNLEREFARLQQITPEDLQFTSR